MFPALINVKSAMVTVVNNVPLDTILTPLVNVSSTVSCLALHVLIISHRSVLLVLDLQFCQEENAILTKAAIKQTLAMIAESDSISTCSKENAIHAPLLQTLMAASNVVGQISSFAVFVREVIISQLKEAVPNALIVARHALAKGYAPVVSSDIHSPNRKLKDHAYSVYLLV